MLDAEENSAQQHRMRSIPAFCRDSFKRAQSADEAGIVEGDIKPTELADGARNQGLHLRLGSDIGLLKNGAAPVFLALTHGCLAALLVQIGNHDRRTFAGETHRGGPTHPARGSGNYCYLIIESSHRITLPAVF